MVKLLKAGVFLSVLVMLLFVGMGCSKKATKVTIPVAEAPVPETKAPKIEDKAKVDESLLQPEEKAAALPKLNLRDVNFDYDKSNLRGDAITILAEHARLLKENPNVKILIEGHCDERGTIEYNLALGERRASAVKNYLKDYGITADRLSTISYGKERPLDSRANEEVWAKNRRAAFVIQ